MGSVPGSVRAVEARGGRAVIHGSPSRRAGLAGLAWIAYHLVRLMPPRLASGLMAFTVSRIVPSVVKERRLRQNLSRAFPQLGAEEVAALRRQVAANFGRLLAEVVHLPTFASESRGARVSVAGATDYPLVRQGQAIFVSAHLGNWELVPIVFTRRGHPLTIIYSKLGIESVDRRLLALRRTTGATYVEKAQALRACLQALKRGESIALLTDQRVTSGIEVDFFGRPTLFTHLPARMAMKFGLPIIVCESYRIAPGHVRLFLHEPIHPAEGRGEEAERVLTQRMARAIEESIRRHPEQWFCNKRRWPKRPEPLAVEEPVSDVSPA